MGILGLPKGIDISDADAVVGDVKSTKTFYSVAIPKKTGTMPTKAIAAGTDTYEEGYHAGDPGGLDAIDADLAPANIKSGVTIFGKVGTSMSFTDYHYYEDLAGGATYTPPASSLAILLNEDRTLQSDVMHIEFYDDAGWVDGHDAGVDEATCHLFQDSNQNIRVANADISAYKISLTGVTWSGATDYRHYEDLAVSTAYTPSAESIASAFVVEGFLNSDICLQLYNGSSWLDAHAGSVMERSRLVLQDNGQNMRVYNADASNAHKISLTGITWS